MKAFFITFEKWFSRFSSIYIILILLTVIKVNYCVYLPGNTTDVANEVELVGMDNSLNGTVSSIYVVDITRASLLTYLIAKAMPSAYIYQMTDEEVETNDTGLNMAVGTFDRDISFSNAELAALSLSDPNFSYHQVTYLYSATSEVVSNMNYKAMVGKLIKTFPGYDFETNGYPKIKDITAYFSTIEIGEDATLTLVVDGKDTELTITKRDVNGTGMFGISIMTSYVLDSASDITIKNNNYSQGPSGGAMQALYMYLILNSSEDLLKGRNIAGTGTIGYSLDTDGNIVNFTTVGMIGCVGQKLYAAYVDKADVFYCPEGNYESCLQYYKDYGFTEKDIRLVCVSTLDDIIADLRETN